MSAVRRSLLMATGENYVGVVASLTTLAVVSRLLVPHEIGVYALGVATTAILLAAREFATTEFLVQRQTVSRDDVRTSFTILMTVSLTVAAAGWTGADAIAGYYGMEELAPFLRVALLAAILEAFALPLIALMRRDMDFGKLALIKVTAILVSGTTTCVLALFGFSFMSFAWASLTSGVVTVSLALHFRRAFWIYQPSLRSWRAAITFGGYNGMCNLLGKATETIPLLVLGRLMPVSAVGLYNRASMICLVPDRIILSGLFSIALPALAREVHAGRDLKEPYLRAISYLSVVYWPTQTMLFLLAYPAVALALGQQWLEVVPLVRLIALSTFFCVPLILTQPTLLATGAFRHYLRSTLITSPFAIVVFSAAAFVSVEAFAASYLVTLPVQAVVQQYFIRKNVAVTWRDLGTACWKSALITAASACGPLLVIALSGYRFDLSPAAFVVAGPLGGLFWLAALVLLRHPLLEEIMKVLGRSGLDVGVSVPSTLMPSGAVGPTAP